MVNTSHHPTKTTGNVIDDATYQERLWQGLNISSQPLTHGRHTYGLYKRRVRMRPYILEVTAERSSILRYDMCVVSRADIWRTLLSIGVVPENDMRVNDASVNPLHFGAVYLNLIHEQWTQSTSRKATVSRNPFNKCFSLYGSNSMEVFFLFRRYA